MHRGGFFRRRGGSRDGSSSLLLDSVTAGGGEDGGEDAGSDGEVFVHNVRKFAPPRAAACIENQIAKNTTAPAALSDLRRQYQPAKTKNKNQIMKRPIILAAAASALLAASTAIAQKEIRETTTIVQPTEMIGTVTEFGPDVIVVRSKEGAAPVRYTFSKTTEYVDEEGNPVAREFVKSGVPVTIRYVKEGDRVIASRVIVRKQTTTTTDAAGTTARTTTTSTVQPTEVIGTVTEFDPDAIVVRTREAADPVRYSFTKTTEYVDEEGHRVSQEIVKSGVPVTVRYVKDGDRMVVSRVIVRKQTTGTEPAAVTTKKTTTTTTTKEKE